MLLDFQLESHARIDELVDAGVIVSPHQNRHVDVLDSAVGVFGYLINIFNKSDNLLLIYF